MAKGLLLAAFDFSTAHEDEFHDWYDMEHLSERLSVPGFISAERWIDEENPKIHVATYELEHANVLRSPAYLKFSNDPTPWTRRITGICRRIMRYEGEQVLPGDALPPDNAGALLLASMNVDSAAEEEFNRWYNTEHLPQLAAVPGVLTARRYRAMDAAPERRYVALYHLTDAAVSRSAAWDKAAYTPWTERIGPHFRDLLVLRMKRYQRAK
jgi:hypothetical protein